MNTVKSIALLILLAVGGAFLWRQSRQQAPLPPLLGELAPLRYIELESTYKVMKRGNRWTTAEGIAADPRLVEQIIGALSEFKARKLSGGEADSEEQFGLLHPEMIVNLELLGEKKTLAFGKRHPLTGARYAKLSGDQAVYLLDEPLVQQLVIGDLRLKEPLLFEAGAVQSVVAKRSAQDELRFERKNGEEAPWRVRAGSQVVPVDTEFFEGKLKGLSALRASDVTLPDPSSPPLVDPVLTLTIEFTAGEPVEVQFFTVSTGIGRKESKFQVTKRREIYTLEGRFFSEFLQPAVYFRDRRPLSQMALTSVKWFCLERGERAIFTARRNDEGWNLSAGFGSAPEVTGKPVQTTLLHTLSELRALAYYDASAALSGVENTEPLHLRLQGESAQVVVTLLRPLSSENQEDVPWFVRVKGGEELTAVIPGAAIEQLKKELTTLEGLLPAQ